MFSIRLGLRNLTRQKRRNIATIFIIAFAFFVYLFVESMMDGLTNMSFDNIRNFETGDIQIAHPDYWEEREEMPLENLIHWNNELEETIRQTQGVTGVSPELQFFANLNNGIDEMGVIGMGIVPEDYNQVFETQAYFTEGSMSALSENKAVIGDRLAKLMDLKMHDYIILLVRTQEDTFNTIDVEIGGIIRTLNPLVNSGTVLLSLESVQKALNTDHLVATVSIKASPGKEEKVLQTVNQNFQEENFSLKAYSWQESAQSLINYSKMEKQAVAAIMSIVLLIGMVGIINNIVLSSLERKSEIGMMKALGMREWEIVFVFMVEAIGIGLLGGLMGCLMGFIGVSWLVNQGISFVALYGEIAEWAQFGIPIMDKIYGVWNYATFGYIFFLGTLVAILSSIIPAYWAAKKDPVEAIYRR
ncbi:MAG: FtsX-like permease family protein [Atribacterota bacterium]|jgi:putative ABC transport system permease protein|nr:FtsX-like permease family protein [Atribacterota bacterium]MDD4895396.1 FtsX-like permease family protein [Atribacterota bacterium]MDD5637955.1 FtsX-like permease family protein [Atribacterota bacterium]